GRAPAPAPRPRGPGAAGANSGSAARRPPGRPIGRRRPGRAGGNPGLGAGAALAAAEEGAARRGRSGAARRGGSAGSAAAAPAARAAMSSRPRREDAGPGGARRPREPAEQELLRRREQRRRRHDAQQLQQLKHLESFYEKPPPGLIKEDETKPEDCIPDVPGNEHAREFLAHAPTKGLWMPLGKEVKVMQCWRCKRYGHRTGDKECPFFIKGNQKLEQFRVAHEDPMYDIIRENKRHEKDV
ncbi:Retinitis pigmentosa 9 protein, partial [Galemys pyrenaicus]